MRLGAMCQELVIKKKLKFVQLLSNFLEEFEGSPRINVEMEHKAH